MTDLEKDPDPSTDGQGDAPNLVTWLINDVMLNLIQHLCHYLIMPIQKNGWPLAMMPVVY